MKKWLAWLPCVAILTTQSPAYAQQELIAGYINQFKDILSTQSGNSSAADSEKYEEIELTEVKSPFVYKRFEVQVNKNSAEYRSGHYAVICPYTGKTFYIGAQDEIEHKPQELVSQKVRSPFTGQMFVAEINMEGLLTGDIDEQVLVCPYTGQEFKFSFQGISPGEARTQQKEGFQMVFDAEAQQYFKVYSKQGQFPDQVQSPYSGKTIFLKDVEHSYSKAESFFNNDLLQNKPFPKVVQFGYDMFPTEESVNDAGGNRKVKASRTRSKNGGVAQGATLGMTLLEISQGGGQSKFEETAFEPISSVPIEPDYVLGPDDEIVVTIWGKVQQTINLFIDRNGKVVLPEAGLLYLWGQTFAEAEKMIINALNNYYTNIKIDVSMGRLRTIRVFVLGDVYRPGGYILSARSTPFHAIFQALGPTKVGSLRNITIKRKSGETKTVDLYKILLKGENDPGIRLESNDVVFINPLGEVSGITGAVKKPAIFELGGTTTLKELVEMAGGLETNANKESLQVIRIDGESNGSRILDVNYNRADTFVIKPGDLVLVSKIVAQEDNYVIVEGYGRHNGQFAHTPGMTLRQLVDKVGGLMPDTYLERVEVFRKTEGRLDELIALDISEKEESGAYQFVLQEQDKVKFFSINEVMIKNKVEIRGGVNLPGEYQYFSNMKINDLVFKAGGVSVDPLLARAEIYTSDVYGVGQIVNVNLSKALNNPDSNANRVLNPGDLLVVRGAKLVDQKRTVFIEGEVQYPGEYIILPGERISDIIERAGGVTPDAFLPGVVFTRETIKEKQLEFAEQLMLKQRQEMLKEESVLLKGHNGGDSSAASRSNTLAHRKELLQLISESKLIGRMVVDVSEGDAFKNSKNNIELMDGDKLIVPTKPSTVQVLGSVYNPSALLFTQGKGPLFYIEKVGGFTNGADKKGVYIIKANGEVDANFYKVKKIELGDTIVVPERFEYKTPRGVIIKDTVQILYQLALGAAVVANLD